MNAIKRVMMMVIVIAVMAATTAAVVVVVTVVVMIMMIVVVLLHRPHRLTGQLLEPAPQESLLPEQLFLMHRVLPVPLLETLKTKEAMFG